MIMESKNYILDIKGHNQENNNRCIDVSAPQETTLGSRYIDAMERITEITKETTTDTIKGGNKEDKTMEATRDQ